MDGRYGGSVTASVNPLIPAAYDLAWSATALALFVLAVVALISLARSARQLSSGQALVWTLVVIFVPALGALAWLFIGRRAVRPAAVAVDRG